MKLAIPGSCFSAGFMLIPWWHSTGKMRLDWCTAEVKLRQYNFKNYGVPYFSDCVKECVENKDADAEIIALLIDMHSG